MGCSSLVLFVLNDSYCTKPAMPLRHQINLFALSHTTIIFLYMTGKLLATKNVPIRVQRTVCLFSSQQLHVAVQQINKLYVTAPHQTLDALLTIPLARGRYNFCVTAHALIKHNNECIQKSCFRVY